ncbi:MAG: DUF6586 family protein [Endozoicomonas sp.]
MINNWQGYTNKMLFHSRLLIEAWESADEIAKPAFHGACLNAMIQAYHSLLAEIMTNHRLPVMRLPSLTDAINGVHEKGEVSSELNYIEHLGQNDSWLAVLLKSHEECLMPVAQKRVDRNEIPVFNENSIRYDLPGTLLSALESLKELVAYSRNFSLEW